MQVCSWCASVVVPALLSVQFWASAICVGQIDWSSLGEREPVSYSGFAHPTSGVPSTSPRIVEEDVTGVT